MNSEPDRVRSGRKIQDLCAAVTRASMKRAQYRLGALGLSSGAYNLLRVIGSQENMTIADVRKVLRIESASVSSLVLRMERDSLLTRSQSTVDKRAAFLKATEHALNMMKEADQVMAIEAADTTHRLSAADQSQLIILLEQTLSNLDASPSGSAS